jgi:hypothetical protein
MTNTLLSPLPSLCLSDHGGIPPATASLCRWHRQPRFRSPKPRSFHTPGRCPRHARLPKSPAILPIQSGSPDRERPNRSEPRLKSPKTDTVDGAYSPAVSSFEAFRTPASVQPLTPVTGRRPKTLNDSGRSLGPQWNREARPSRDILGHTSGTSGWPESSHPRQTARHADAGSRQLVEQRLCVLEIGGVEALGEPAVNGRQEVARLRPPALFPP